MVARKTPSDGTTTEAAKPKRKRVKVKAGQIVAVPLLDCSWALAHVAVSHLGIIVAHYNHRAKQPEQLLDGMEDAMRSGLFSILAVTDDEIYDGHWPVIGHREPNYPAELLDMKGRSYTASATRCLFEAAYGLRPWDEMVVPRWYDRMLLPGLGVPATARYKADFERAGGAGAAGSHTPRLQAEAEPPITEGPGVIHIEIKYPGEELPTMPLLKRRQAIETGLEAAGVGEVTDAGGGGGVMDIYLESTDVARALPFVNAAIKEAGFENDARVEVVPVSEDDEDGDGEDGDPEEEGDT